MSISIIFIHVNNFSIILICNEKTAKKQVFSSGISYNI